jgi:hypothetical protein
LPTPEWGAQTSQTQQINMQQQQQQRRQYPQQQQQQLNSQQSRGSERTGIRVLELPTQTQPFPVHFEREQNAQKRARQQAQVIARLEDMTLLSDDEVASSEEDYVAYAKSYKHQGAAAWLEDEGVFDSSDDIDIIPDSDDDDDQF